MNIKLFIKKIFFPKTYSKKAYIDHLRREGVIIGEHTEIYSPNRTSIDTNKFSLITIGDYCKITSGVTILAHDYSRSVPRRVYGQFVGGSLPVRIGDNVFIGVHATILMGTTIGNNCIVGAGSVVSGTFPDNVVIAGNPAKVVCTLKDYYEKARKNWIEDAKRCALSIYEHTGRRPTVEEMSDTYVELYMPHTQETIRQFPHMFDRSADEKESIIEDFLKTEPVYESFDMFLRVCGIDEEYKKS